MSEFTVYTMTDKAKRDALYLDLRNSVDPKEREAVKFSGVEPVLNNGVQAVSYLPNYAGRMNKLSKSQAKRGMGVAPQRTRPHYVSNWSVAYPS